jgi:hypothetical protein
VAGAGCEPHPVGKLGDRQPAIGLQLGKDRPVNFVHSEELLPMIAA